MTDRPIKTPPPSKAYRDNYDGIFRKPKPADDYDDPCPECGAQLRAKMSGVECPRCPYWFCY